MLSLPAAYAWLEREAATGGPRMLVEALKTYGIAEVPGPRDNTLILEWAREVGLAERYRHDEQAWCGLYAAVIVKRAEKPPCPKSPLWALNWGLWGEDGGQPELFELLTFVRPGGGHVGFYVGEDATHYHVWGGNQGNSVSIRRIERERLRACRALYRTRKPDNVRPVLLSAEGAPVSTNEA